MSKRQSNVLAAAVLATTLLSSGPGLAQSRIPYPVDGLVLRDARTLVVPISMASAVSDTGATTSFGTNSVTAVCPGGWRLLPGLDGLDLQCGLGAALPGSDEGETYRIGVGDILEISVYDVSDLQKTVTVKGNGTISFPLVGDVLVNGLTASEIQARMSEKLLSFVKDPQVGVSVKDYQSQWVNVLGHVSRAGKVYLKGASRLLDVISEAGGFASTAGDEIEIRHGGGAQAGQVIDRDKLMNTGDPSLNVLVRHGDVVHVKEQQFVYVNGEVRSAGSFPWKKGMTVLKAITEAGGFTEWAKKQDVRIIRAKGGEMRINVRDIERGEAEDVSLLPDDKVVVGERRFS